MRNLRIISSQISRSFKSISPNPFSNSLISIQSRRYSSENVSGADKTEFDLILRSYDPTKYDVVKEVSSVTDLGWEEASELVRKAPTFLKRGVSKEEAEMVIEKLKAVGAKVSMN